MSTRPYRSALREMQARHTRAAIREAAYRLFIEQGYVATSTKQVAAAAGVSERTVFAAFPTKAALYHEVMDVITAGDEEPVPLRDRPGFKTALAQTDGRAAVTAIADFASAVNERAAAIIVVAIESSGADADMRRLADAGATAMRDNMQTVAKALRKHGALRPGLSAGEAGDTLFALLSPQTHQLLRVRCGWPASRYRRWLEDRLAEALL